MDKTLEDNLEEQVETVIGPSAFIQGDLTSEDSIKIEGQLIGTIKTSKTLIVSENAKVMAEVEAESAVIGGEVQGHLQISGRLVLLSTARVAADVSCPTLRVEEGALFTGKCHMAGNIPIVHIKKPS
jgi:cytoskeletal protein CcmA (bactofilin family)